MTSTPVTLVTGTRKGIGKSLAEHYVRLGHHVVGCSRSPVDWQLTGYSHHAVDVTDEAAVVRLFGDIKREHGRLDHLVNNAGIAAMNHALLTPASTVRSVMSTNVLGSFLFCREAAKVMRRARTGRIVNFATVAVPLKLEGEAVYVASKAAVIALTEVLAREFADFGVTVNAVGPTPVDTDLIRGVPRDKIQRLIDRQAIHRLGTFDDVANVVDFFLRPESGFITGQTVFLGGV